jgi:methyl-accepting chemotaxis protein
MATAMQEMTATAQEVSGHAAKVAELTREENGDVGNGLQTMRLAQGSVTRLAGQVEKLLRPFKSWQTTPMPLVRRLMLTAG